MNNSPTNQTTRLWPAGIFLLCAFLIAVACYAAYVNIEANEKSDANRTLSSVGQLKTSQIQSYLSERKSDASVLTSFLSASPAQDWLTRRGGDAPVMLRRLAESVVTGYGYRGLLLLDSAANIRMNVGQGGILTEAGKATALRAMRERSPAAFEIYFGDPSIPDEPVQDTFVPVLSPDGTMVVGMIVLRNELDFLFQLLQTWPVESATAESLLVARDGNEVLFLNDLRHQKGAAGRLRIPLSTDINSPAWPAISAAMGQFGPLEANDYRGVRVLGYTLAVPATPWRMVVKMDMEEAVAHTRRLLRLAMIIAVTLIVLTGYVIWLWWRKEEADRLASRQLQESETRYRRLHESMMDAFVMVDMSGRLLDFNHTFREMLGYSAEELLRLSCADLTPEKWHEFEKRIIAEQVIPNGQSQVYEKEYRRKDGTVLPVELKFSRLTDKKNQPEAMWAIVRDITERKLAQLNLQHNEELLKEAQRLGQLGCWELNLTSGELYWTDEVYRIFELDPARFSPSYENFLNVIHPDDRDRVNRAYTESLENRRPYDVVHRLLFAEGRIKWVREHCDSEFDASGKPLRSVGAVQDITRQKQTEDAIAREGEKFRTLFESISDAIIICDMEGHIIQVNRSACERLGYSKEELQRMTPADIDTPEYAAKVMERFREIRKQGKLVFESAHVRKDGTVIPIELNARVVDYDGQPAVLSVARDITERRQDEDMLRFHSQILENLSEGIFLSRASDGIIVFTNAQFERMFGYQPDELAGKHVSILNASNKNSPEAVAAGIMDQLAQSGRWSGEVHNVRKDGTRFWCHASVSTFDHFRFGRVWVAIHTDITGRKQAEAEKEALRVEAIEARALLQTVLDSTPDWVFAKDGKHRFLFVNRAFAAAQGYAPQEMIGRPDTDFWPDDLCNGDPSRGIRGFHADDDAAMAGNLTHNPNDPATLADGELRTFDTLKMPLRDTNGRCYAVLAYARDVTDRKTAEQRMRELTAHLQTVREEEKASIAREIHDDLGGTLTALKMEAYWLAEELSASRETEPLLKHVELMSQLTENAVNVTRRVITGLRPTILDDLGLLAAIEWQAEQFRKHTGIECRVHGIEDKVKLDRQYAIALFRIFQESLTNVARHSGASSVEVEFHGGCEEVMLSIRDNGRGLPQGHTVASGSYGMRGMTERVEQLGGKIRFDSPPGGGCSVTVILPLPVENKEGEEA